MKEYISKLFEITKKHIGIVFLMAYQYVIWFAVLVGILISALAGVKSVGTGLLVVFYVIYGLSTLITLFITIFMVGKIKKGMYSVHETVLSNLIIKASNTPVNLFNLLVMVYLTGAKEYGLLVFMLVLTGTALIITDMYFVACSKMVKDAGLISSTSSVFAPISGLIIGVDLIVSVNYVKKTLNIKSETLAYTVLELIKESISYIPIIIYPYFAYMIVIVWARIGTINVMPVAAVYHIFILGFIIYSNKNLARRDVYTIATMNFLVKLSHIPGYFLHVFVFFIGMCLGVFGGPIVMAWALFMLIAPMLISGINAIPCMVRLRKEGLISGPKAVIRGILSFVYVCEIFTALCCVIDATKREVTKRVDIEGTVDMVKDTVKNVTSYDMDDK